jgi:hypothetical protein
VNLKEQMDADLANVFMNTDAFAEECTFRPVSDEEYVVIGIFDSPHEEVTPGMASVSSVALSVTIRETSFRSKPTRKDTITIRQMRYAIRDIQPDGVGLLHLFLSEKFPEA